MWNRPSLGIGQAGDRPVHGNGPIMAVRPGAAEAGRVISSQRGDAMPKRRSHGVSVRAPLPIQPRGAHVIPEAPHAIVDPEASGSYLNASRLGVSHRSAEPCAPRPWKVRMFASIARSIFGSANDRSLKS